MAYAGKKTPFDHLPWVMTITLGDRHGGRQDLSRATERRVLEKLRRQVSDR